MSEEEEQSLESAVFRALGQVSVCWSEKPSGTFDSTRAVQIGEELLEEIEKYYEQHAPMGKKVKDDGSHR